MKLIKKIAAIMFAFMMVVSMSTNVSAEGTNNGTITINNAVDGQTYTIYKLLDLESYTPDPGTDDGIYSYKPNKLWKNFIETAVDSASTNYFKINENGYATWNGDTTDSRKAEFAQKALAYAKDEAHPIAGDPRKKEEGKTLTFTNLSLGYYLVDSSVGTLCSLDTTKPAATIQEKNGVPSVDKIITSGGVVSADGKSNSASIGDTVNFKTTITAQPGAQNYVLHDKMTEGLTFDKNSINVSLHKKATNADETLVTNTDYNVETINLKDTDLKCTFHINFTQTLCNRLAADDTITVTYSATLNDKAVIGSTGNVNETKLNYGDSKETTESKTHTFTYDIPVFKYTMKDNVKTGLEHAKFTLSLNEDGANPIKFKESNENNKYIKDETGAITEVESPQDGKLTFEGLGAGTYYLTETKQPDGYNKLAKSVKIEMDANGTIKVDGKSTLESEESKRLVEVENKTGTVLPSTGGMGTTMIYLVGAVLVLGSGVVLATKRRVKNK
ncbi:SpaH/EbpB family LPXTG-anchored major pilin [uncultured Holdemanella sp.]|uniref:SpaH/EbpB family LPXTG-anchored major pilin n=1 Tax=uncultured Holdemanella sp. TaxID=1763549 RepID=UPI00258BF42D|nr:SpaH/EbpB family LPXTG-anchored major pilin [uncultured Holdemanella sp.]